MKRTIIALVLITNSILGFAQPEAEKFKHDQLVNKNLSAIELKSKLTKLDFSYLFTHADNSEVFGFIGDNYQRIRIKFISVFKVNSSTDTYMVFGKSMVKNSICTFRGTLKISNIRKFLSTSSGVDGMYKNKGIKGEYTMLGEYSLPENMDQKNSGVFNGVFQSNFYIDKYDHVKYDDIDLNADGYSNNQFVGQWNSYRKMLMKRCNWGDYRIPNSGDLDIGAGDFSPADKYLKVGWQSLRDSASSSNNKIAKTTKETRWWK